MPGNKYSSSNLPGTPRTRLERLLRERELKRFSRELSEGEGELSSAQASFSPESSLSWLNDEESLQPVSGARTSHDGSERQDAQASKQRLLVVANRLPVSAERHGDSWQLEMSAGGLVSALLGKVITSVPY